jgi:hypothetical protein
VKIRNIYKALEVRNGFQAVVQSATLQKMGFSVVSPIIPENVNDFSRYDDYRNVAIKKCFLQGMIL